MTEKWPDGYAKVTIQWEDGWEFVAERVKIKPGDLLLAEEPEPRDWFDPLTNRAPRKVEKVDLRLYAEIHPDDEDVLHTFKEPR